jgi:CDP-diacylglycerol--glycerol-3-phosphate 3-phosphatidyltransferase
MVILIISREFVITGLRSIAASKNIIIPASKAGKFKTTSQIITIILVMIILIYNSALWHYYHIRPSMMAKMGGWNSVIGWSLTDLPFILMFITTILTLVSGLTYLAKHRDILRE